MMGILYWFGDIWFLFFTEAIEGEEESPEHLRSLKTVPSDEA